MPHTCNLNTRQPVRLGRVPRHSARSCAAAPGGFTDCLLQHGAARVYGVDVGHSQLADRLRADARVVVKERFNLRNLTPADLPEQASGAGRDLCAGRRAAPATAFPHNAVALTQRVEWASMWALRAAGRL